jgi:hypothetical protein
MSKVHSEMGRAALFVLFFLFAELSLAKLSIPTGMTSADRVVALEALGYGTTSKLLGDPYPLGGYSGVEIGITTEVISTADLARLGTKTTQQSETSYSAMTLGKGLYQNVDGFLQFSLSGNSENISNFGGQVRWGFFQAEYIPAFLSLVLSGGSTNFQNLIITNNQGLDLVLGVNVDDVTLYLGVGQVRTQGTFVGGTSGITDTGTTMKESVVGSHYLAGINLKFSKVFVAMEIDRYTQSNYSAKLGVRF